MSFCYKKSIVPSFFSNVEFKFFDVNILVMNNKYPSQGANRMSIPSSIKFLKILLLISEVEIIF